MTDPPNDDPAGGAPTFSSGEAMPLDAVRGLILGRASEPERSVPT